MAQLIQLILELSSSVKEMMALILVLKRSRAEEYLQPWIDSEQLMTTLKISKRNLQTMRDTGVLPYTRLSGKFYYKVNDIEKLLNDNYSKNFKLKQYD